MCVTKVPWPPSVSSRNPFTLGEKLLAAQLVDHETVASPSWQGTRRSLSAARDTAVSSNLGNGTFPGVLPGGGQGGLHRVAQFVNPPEEFTKIPNAQADCNGVSLGRGLDSLTPHSGDVNVQPRLRTRPGLPAAFWDHSHDSRASAVTQTWI